jgi:hypothetical protein
LDVDDPVAVVRTHRAAIERRIRLGYLNGRLEPDGSLLLRTPRATGTTSDEGKSRPSIPENGRYDPALS